MIELLPQPDISGTELETMYRYRLDRIRQTMADHNISLTVLTSPVTMRYAVNFDEYLLFQSHIPTAMLF